MKLVLVLLVTVAPLFAEKFPFARDIYSNDAEMRQKATSDELRWTVYLGGCTGSMLTARYLLTAAHCSPRVGKVLTSGACLDLGCERDLVITKIVESYSDLDSTLVEVAWKRTDSKWHQRYSPKIQISDDELTFGPDGTATELFTVGFPGDKEDVMTARGFAKGRDSLYLQYNVGSINGNSGGAVWKTADFTLVSQTNHGPHQLGSPGWNNNNPENKNAWNGGPRMNLVYAKSPLLKTLFPSGYNPRVSFEGFLVYDDSPVPKD